MCMHMEATGQPWMPLLRDHLPKFLRHSLSLSWCSLIELGWLIWKCQESPCLHFPRTGIINKEYHTQLFCWFWGSNSDLHTCKASILLSELSPPPMFYYIYHFILYILYIIINYIIHIMSYIMSNIIILHILLHCVTFYILHIYIYIFGLWEFHTINF